MINNNELIDQIKSYNRFLNSDSLNKAYNFALEAHQNQKRDEGVPYIIHPVAVAKILTDLKLDSATITTGLLHDTIEDTNVTYDTVKKEFGEEVANLVEGVTKISALEDKASSDSKAENFRKLILATSKDIRVLLVKLADRLHNMRTIQFVKDKDKIVRKAKETMEIYAPLADRMGMNRIRDELEDLSFSVLNKPARDLILERLNFIKNNTQDTFKSISIELIEILKKNGITAIITGREKTPFSIWRKIQNKKISLEQLTDIIGFRVIVNNIEDCYRTLGIFHSRFSTIPGKFKDYISTPKINKYKSIHTAVIGPKNNRIEIQIRTHDMDELAEFGVAAHWFYKTGKSDNPAQSRARRWVNTLVEVQKNIEDPQDFIDVVKTGLVPNEIYVFTPNGDIVELPKDSTPIDFAFAVHSDIGLHCKGCRINKNLAPLSVPLESGQTINIITDKYPQANPTWLEFVRTSRARSAIRNSTKNLKASKARKFGKNLLEQSLRPHHIKLRNVPKARMSKLLSAINVKSVRELLEQIGSGQRSSLVVAHQIIQFLDYDQKDLIEFSNIQISGSEGLVISYAACCKPIPGDNIIAHFSNQKGIVIHTERCKNMTVLRKDPAHCAPVQWENEVKGDFSVEIKIISDDRPGLLAEISSSISEANSNIVNFRMDPPAGSSIQMFVVIELKDRQHLAKIMRRLRRLKHVISVLRIHNQDQKIESISR